MFFEETNNFNSDFDVTKYCIVKDAIKEDSDEKEFKERSTFEYLSEMNFATLYQCGIIFV